MKTLRTPDERFENLPGYPYEPKYTEVPDGDGGTLRIHFVDEGLSDADPVLLMHGEPSWSYLYRKMIPIIVNAGYRAVAPDLAGFGRSDKPSDRNDSSYQRHVDWMQAWLNELGISSITLVCQDWGGLIGLRLVADRPDRFARIVAANTGLPTGDHPVTEAFLKWRKFSQEVPEFDVGFILQGATQTGLSDDILAAYRAPFPDESYKEGARIFPSLVPISPDDPAAPANRKAWEALTTFEKPFLTAFSDKDPVTAGGDRIFQKLIPGAKGQPHTTIKGGGHFLQEDCGEEFARVVVDFIARTSN
ncbi:MAG: haloalkane dehalogenase [Deltaproteobacteria bacterium]|nr:MAG: haloalkane dehalogenase [Deltaproteobacteria bacterium]